MESLRGADDTADAIHWMQPDDQAVAFPRAAGRSAHPAMHKKRAT